MIGLKEKILRAGFSLLGIPILNPGGLRAFLLKKLASVSNQVAVRENVHLFIQAIAESYPGYPIACSIARDPERFCSLYDTLLSAGWGPESFASLPVRRIALELEDLLACYELKTASSWDQYLLKKAQERTVCDTVLMYGFTAVHWPLYALLKAAVHASRHTKVCLLKGEMSRAEEVWIGTWEEMLGECVEISDARISSFQGLVRRMEGWGADRPTQAARVRFLVGCDRREESEAVVAQTLSFLSACEDSRVAIVVGSVSALAREVAAGLAAEHIPHHDTLGYVNAPLHKPFMAWLCFQEDARLEPFLKYMDALRDAGQVSAARFKHCLAALERAFLQVGTDDVTVLMAYLLATADPAVEQWASIGAVMQRSTLFSVFVEHAVKALSFLGWSEMCEWVQMQAEGLRPVLARPLSRRSFVRWLHCMAVQLAARGCNELGQHEFARVQLVTAQEAVGLSWSHLILAGLNEGEWLTEQPESPLMQEGEWGALNAKVLKQGRQGKGHVISTAGYLLSAQERRIYAQSLLARLLEGVRYGVAVTASLMEASNSRRPRGVSSELMRLYQAQEGSPLTQKRFTQLQRTTRAWLAGVSLRQRSVDTLSVEETLNAWQARRDAKQPFGPFEFAFRDPPTEEVALSCKAFEQAMKRPESVWLCEVLGVRKPLNVAAKDNAALSLGTWVHAWLRVGQGNLTRNLPIWRKPVENRSKQAFFEVQAAYKQAGRALPDWWRGQWQQALRQARLFSEILSEQKEWPFVGSEIKLPADARGRFSEAVSVPLKGRIDLLFARERLANREQAAGDAFLETPLWIIDFKTGAAQALKWERLLRGEGVQLALYALALYGFGYKNSVVSILGRDMLLYPQLHLNDLLTFTELWEGLAVLSSSGVFGQARKPTTSDHPLAMLAIDADILKKKWQLTHPQLPFPKDSYHPR